MSVLKTIAQVVVLYVVTIGIMVGASFAWVWFYSVAVNTTGDHQFYEAYAQTASPIVAVVTAFPVFYGMGAYLRRFEQGIYVAMAVLLIHVLVELVVLLNIPNPAALTPFSVGAAILKFAGTWLALRGKRTSATA